MNPEDPAGQPSARAAGPLDGIRVADLSRVVAGPYAAMLLGDLGADVVKVERPDGGDDARGFGPPFVDGQSSYFRSVNRNKRSVAWDLRSPEGRTLGFELASRADVVIENFMPGTAERLGIGYEQVRDANPRVVYCSVSGFGAGGPGSSLPGYDFLVQGVGGLMSITGDADGEPRKVGVAVVDVLTAQFAVAGILAALYERESSGVGQLVEVNLLSSLLSALVNQASTYVTTGMVPSRMGNRHPSIAPYETLHAKDRPFVLAVASDRQFAVLCSVLGLPELSDDDRFRENSGRVVNRQALVAVLEEALAARPAEEWIASIQAAGIPCGPVNDIAEAFALAERLGLAPVLHVSAGHSHHVVPEESSGASQVRNPIGLSRTPVTYRRGSPHLAEHSAEIEAELGH